MSGARLFEVGAAALFLAFLLDILRRSILGCRPPADPDPFPRPDPMPEHESDWPAEVARRSKPPE